MANRPLRVVLVFVAAVAAGAAIGSVGARGQAVGTEPTETATEGTGEGGLSSADEARLQLLSDPEAIKKKAGGKDRTRPPIEIFKSQIAPNDVVPWLKAHQWSSLTLDLQANDADYEGELQSLPVSWAAPYEVVFSREARLVKEQRSRLGMQVLLPQVPQEKELLVALQRPDAIRADQLYAVPLRPLPPHQMMVMVLTRDANGAYASWSRYAAMIPATFDRGDSLGLELARYYRLLLPLDVEKPMLPAHPLTWASLSHIVWDGMAPDALSTSQQSALLDWIHWGGQLIVVGGAGPSAALFRESFLDPYLPADSTGEGRLLAEADLRPLSNAYPPPFRLPVGDEALPRGQSLTRETYHQYGRGYLDPEPIRPAPDRRLYIAGLRPRDGAATIPLGAGSSDLLAVEQRVGRGRITMLSINPTDPALAAWGGLDTLIRRVVLRRPEEAAVSRAMVGQSYDARFPGLSMSGPDLSWYRIAARDVGPRMPTPPPEDRGPARRGSAPVGAAVARPSMSTSLDFSTGGAGAPNLQGIAEWVDTTRVPVVCRKLLQDASGITAPSSRFVLLVILAYLMAVAPLNWLLCRFVLKRREAAWVFVPLLAFGFAAAVERVAAYDMGYDSACDEIDLLELQGAFPRGHLSRFASIYTTGRERFTIGFPDNPTALALPLDLGRSILGEDRTTMAWRSHPVPALDGFVVQPRSLSMFRAEEMTTLPGSVVLDSDGGRRVLRNDLGRELRDATLVDFSDADNPEATFIGTIGAGAAVDLDALDPLPIPDQVQGFDGPDPGPLLAELRAWSEKRPESLGELRLIAWAADPIPGPSFTPALDRHRGATVVVAHLRYPPPPSPSGPHYDASAPEAAGGTVPRARRETGAP